MSFVNMEFIIDGIKSSDIGVDGIHLIRTDSQITTPIMGNKSIIEDKVKNKDIPYFYGVEKSPIEFDLKFSLLEREFTPDRLLEIGKIFCKDKYVSFQSSDYLGKIFYVLCTSMELETFGMLQGWLNCRLRTSAPYAFSPIEISTFEIDTAPTTIELINKSNVSDYYEPILSIDLVDASDTSIVLTNLSDGGRTFGFTGLSANESLVIDNAKKKITSSTGNARIGNLTGKKWFRLTSGVNYVTCNKKATIQIKSQYSLYI